MGTSVGQSSSRSRKVLSFYPKVFVMVLPDYLRDNMFASFASFSDINGGIVDCAKRQ